MADLDDLRARIDQLDGALIAIVAERLAVCRQVAAVKEGTDTPVIQPARVRDVVDTRRQQAIEAGIDPDFAEQLFRVLLTETHRIEVAGHRPDAAPEKPASDGRGRSGLDTVATRVDHIVIAVDDLELATATLQTRFGFHEVADGRHAAPGIRTLAAGGVTLVLVGPQGVAQRGRLPRATRAGRAARRHRGAQRRLRPCLPGRRRHAAVDRGARRRRRPRAVLRRVASRPPEYSSASSRAPAIASASAPTTCWPCSTPSGQRRHDTSCTTVGLTHDREGRSARSSQRDSRPLCSGNNPTNVRKGSPHAVPSRRDAAV